MNLLEIRIAMIKAMILEGIQKWKRLPCDSKYVCVIIEPVSR